ncbi:LamG-like jellyroll fold domain-containing protein, partial [Polaribacter sp.]|uniref:LamG-like jellyroll fold domain-containing protein n=1 Tax=Polaribacter sp. TaxID=1920175 RepID=UPI003F6BF81A
ENITVSTAGGTPQIAITIGATVRQASYISGSGGSALLFRYTVQNGDNDTDGIAVGTLASNGGTLRDSGGANANLTLNSVGNTTSVLVDAVDPTVTSVTVPANATYIAGQNLDFTVNFNENITVSTTGGTPQIAITIGATVRQASYISGSGGSALLFRYTVQNGDNDTDGIAVGTLASNGGTLRDAAGNNANLTLNSVGSTTSVLVDANVPSLSSSSPADEGVSIGKSSNITLTFNENIAFGTGNIQVIDVTDGSNSFAINVASATTQVAINGAVLTINSISDLDYNTNYAIQIATTAITDTSGNNFAGITDNTTLDFTTELTSGTGTHLNFDGTDDVVDMGSTMTSVLDDINTFTVEARVRTTTTSGFGVIAGVYDYPSTGVGMQFLLRRDGTSYTFWIDHGTGFKNVTATSAVSQGVWQHVAGTWDGTNMRIYVDGVLVNTVGEAAASFRTISGANLAIGGNAHAENFTGDIDEVRIWKKVRTDAEILANKDGEISNTETDLLAYYQFNQGTGEANNSTITNLTDNSVNNYTGTLTNFALSGIASNWLSPALIWTGTTDNNWSVATNWNKSVLPTATADITIPTGLT